MSVAASSLRALIPLSLTWVISAPMAAQVAVSFAGVAAQPYSTVDLSGNRERIGGIWAGASITIASKLVTISATGLSGTMKAIDNTIALDRDGGEISGFVRVSPVPWFGFEGGYTVRAFNSAAGYQKWQIPHVGVTLSGKLGHPALRAHLSAAYLPSVKVSGLETPDLGIAAKAAVSAEPPRVPLYFQVSYRLERYDFPTGSTSRLEQFDRVAVSVGLRLGSRWPSRPGRQ